MATTGNVPQLVASATVLPFRCIKVSGAFQGSSAAAATDVVVGVSDASTRRFDDTTNHALSGEPISVQTGKVVQVTASAAISAGAKCVPTTNGMIVTGASGNATQFIALEAASAAGDIIWVMRVGSSPVV